MTDINAAILGASGYGAGELLRLLTQHPRVRVVAATSTSAPGEPLEKLHPHLRGFYSLRTSETLDIDRLLQAERAVIFSALPHGLSGAAAADALARLDAHPRGERGVVIDLSGDLRLRDMTQHRRHYPGAAELPAARGSAIYGLPELLCGELAHARLIANPGCLATAAILAVAPLVDERFSGTVVIDAKTGSSGSGRALKETTHHPTRHADFRAYKPLAHQHEGEILQAWGDARSERIALSFVAQSMDTARGIFVTAHLTLAEAIEPPALRERYTNFYEGRPFVRIVEDSPTLQDVVGANFCDIAVTSRGKQVIAMAAIDNLVKGMAGTAIQNMNLCCGLPETTGLWAPALRPV